MERYPSIDGSSKAPLGKPCIAFYKYDGSNLRWEWNPKKGWFKFGTRTQLFDKNTELYNQAIPLFMKMGDEIVRRVKSVERECQRITAYTEFFGASSFAGTHLMDEPKELRLFDVYLFKKGLMKPRQFLKVFGDMPQTAEVFWEGTLGKDFINKVRNQSEGILNEGVVCKGDDFMVKIKTKHFLDKLKEVYANGWENYWE